MNCSGISKVGALLKKLIASVLFSGYLPVAPGTWGSAWACVVLWLWWPAQWYFQALVILLFYPLAIYFSTAAERLYGRDDRRIVIDEFAGQMVALFMVPKWIIAYMLAFLLFRFYDIVKLPPARHWEKLPSGFGVVADDFAAAIHASVTLHLILTFSRRIGVSWAG